MKCTNKLCAILMGAVLVFQAGCGSGVEELSRPYDIYETTAGVGLAASKNAEEKTFFSDGLCVADDVAIGTEDTDSYVAGGAAAFNVATGEVVYAKNLYTKLYPASTTKVLTAYIVLKYAADLDETVTVSENAADQEADSSVCGVKAGDRITMRDLLYGLMLRSGNDAAIAIAEHMSGSVEAFAELMNQEALNLGATQSHFVNPNGLPDENHYTSVYDMYLLFNEAIKNEAFVQLISTKSYDTAYTDAEGNPVEHTWENTNQYLAGNQTAPEGFTVVGGKTGTTGDAGYCLVLYSYNAKGEPIISIVFKADGRSNLYLLMNEILQGYAN